MRSVVFSALLLAVAASGCGNGGEVAVVAGAPAGDVTEVAGSVTATREGQARALKVGDAVAGDDVIATGADARITITLRHNHVPWSLGPGKSRRVADSAAWRAAEGANAAEVTDDQSGAAGRHAERGAADTVASADTERGGGTAAPATGPDDKRPAQALRQEPVKSDPESKPKQLPSTGGGPGAGSGDPGVPVGGRRSPGGGSDVPPPPPPPSGPSEAEIRRMWLAKQAALKTCYTAALATHPDLHGTVAVALAVKADGTVTRADVTPSDGMAEVGACVHDRLRKLRFPAVSGDWSMSIPITFASAN
ncbi:MAG: AgmX/PglI C-terminal domain-containing protein [Deltaproteobacteria bacterium]|nr:AgmX/PglI C-terminal domain-containing protein [Deltaproteobacteria bacterium]